MSNARDQAMMRTAISQIGLIIGRCAEEGLDKLDISIIMQTSMSLLCEMNSIETGDFLLGLYVVHKKRMDEEYDASDLNNVLKDLRGVFAADGSGVTWKP